MVKAIALRNQEKIAKSKAGQVKRRKQRE